MRMLLYASCACAFLLGCGTGKRVGAGSESADSISQEVTVEAYLFDLKLRRDGKPTSLRLYLYQTDSVIWLNGKAYLGKGAIEGYLNRDSLFCYFPTSTEFLYESLEYFLSTMPCAGDGSSFDLFALFSRPPDELVLDTTVRLASNRENSDKPEFTLAAVDCDWTIELQYDSQDDGFRVRRFSYSDGRRNSLKATRREYKRSVRLTADRVRVDVEAGAARVTP